MVLGTAQYMSPEQARGHAVDARTDVWSLGAILYEMLTGRPPFEGETASDVMAAVLERDLIPINAFRPAVPLELEEVVLAALHKDRAARIPTMREFVARLETAAERMASGMGRRAPRRVGRRWVLVLGGAATVAAFAAAVRFATGIQRATPTRVDRVAVTTFDNASGDSSFSAAGRLIADYFAGAVGTIDRLAVVDRDAIIRAEANARETRRQPEDAHLALARESGATLLVSGTLYSTRDSLQVQVTLVDASTGAMIRALRPLRVWRLEPTRGLDLLRDRLLGALALITDPMFGRGMLPAGEPPTLAAYLEVREGLELEAALRPLDANDAERESELSRFARAASIDTGYLQARLWLASAALRRFGGEALADSALAFVHQRAERLSTFERAVWDALRADAEGNHELSARAWRRASGGGSWPARWWLANKLRDANRPREALAVFDSLGRLDAHFLRAVPSIRHYVGDYLGELAALRAEQARMPSVTQTLDFQQAQFQAFAALDSVDAITRGVDAIVSLPAQGGSSVAYLLTRTAWELGAHRHPEAAARLLTQAFEWCVRRTARDLRNAAVSYDCLEVYGATGHRQELEHGVREALRSNPGDLALEALVGLAAATRGDRPAAERASAAIEARARLDGSRGFPEWTRARIAAILGQRDAAVALLRDAFARGGTWAFRLDLHRDPAFTSLRGYPPFQQLMQGQG
jgi:TolB-like protein